MIDQYLEFGLHILESVPEGRLAIKVGLCEVQGQEVVLSVEVVYAFPYQSLEILRREVD